MYTLRKIGESGEGLEINISLGKTYTLVLEAEQPELVKECKEKEIITNDPIIFGYVVGEDLEVHELSVQQRLYIMTENGQTFAKLKA